jgi:hypothetical protein
LAVQSYRRFRVDSTTTNVLPLSVDGRLAFVKGRPDRRPAPVDGRDEEIGQRRVAAEISFGSRSAVLAFST